jgi:hypothetical protein
MPPSFLQRQEQRSLGFARKSAAPQQSLKASLRFAFLRPCGKSDQGRVRLARSLADWDRRILLFGLAEIAHARQNERALLFSLNRNFQGKSCAVWKSFRNFAAVNHINVRRQWQQ